MRGFIFTDEEILKISHGFIIAVAKYVMFMSSVRMAGEKQIFAVTEGVKTDSV